VAHKVSRVWRGELGEDPKSARRAQKIYDWRNSSNSRKGAVRIFRS